MNTAAAIELISSSKSIGEWNLNREIIKREFGVRTHSGTLITKGGVALRCKGILVSEVDELLSSPLPQIDKMCGKILKQYVKKTA